MRRSFECRRVLEQHPAASTEPGTDHDRCRGRQTKRIRTGDHHDGDGKEQRFSSRAVAEQRPRCKRAGSTEERDEHQPESGPVGKPLAWCFGVLRLLNELNDLGERCVSAHSGCAHPQDAISVDSRSDDLNAGFLVDWKAFARHHRLVDIAVALFDDPVHGDLRSRSHQQQVPDRDLCGRHLDRFAIAQHNGHRRGEVEQSADCIVRPTSCTHFEPVTEQYECCENGRRFVEHLTATRERDDDRVDPASTDRYGDEDHHVERPCPQRPDSTIEEDRRGPQHDRQAQYEGPDIVTSSERGRRLEADHVAADR